MPLGTTGRDLATRGLAGFDMKERMRPALLLGHGPDFLVL